MKRLHVHIAVENLADSVRFYSTLFAAEPSVMKSDYAKWMLDDPRVNFAISQRGNAPGLNHLGVQVESDAELGEMHARLRNLDTGVTEEANAACCYAKSDKYWVNDPQGLAWETFHTLDSIPIFGGDAVQQTTDNACCIPLAKSTQAETSPCCTPLRSTKSEPGACC